MLIKWKGEPQTETEVLAKHISDIGHLCKIHQEILNSTIRKQTTQLKNGPKFILYASIKSQSTTSETTIVHQLYFNKK